MSAYRVLSVGQCAYDHRNLVSSLGRRLSLDLSQADTFDEALDALRRGTFQLLLVNRVTDVDGSLGLDLIRQVKTDPQLQGTPIMLISDYASAQEEATRLGALPGFGKSELGREATAQRVEQALANGLA